MIIDQRLDITTIQLALNQLIILVHNEAFGLVFDNCTVLYNTKNLNVTKKDKDYVDFGKQLPTTEKNI